MRGEVCGLEGLTSRGVHPGARSAVRLDPYWDGLWASGSLASWVSVDSARRQAAAGLARIPAPMTIDPAEAWDAFRSRLGWRRKLEMLGTLNAWRTLSAQQLGAFVGAPILARRNQLPDLAFACHLIDHGIFTNGLTHTRRSLEGRLFRPSASRVFDKYLAPLLTYPERILVTGGRRLRVGGQFDRHNLLTAELALRAAEFTSIVAAMGETYATMDMLLGTGLGREEVTGNPAADAVLIRPDGMRVAIELTATIGKNFEEKVRRWAGLMSQVSMARSGLVVLFVGAPPPDRGDASHRKAFATKMGMIIRKVVGEFPGVPGTRVADRIGMAMWTDYFPASGKLNTAFLSLQAWIPSGAEGAPWAQVGMLDEVDTPFEPLDAARTGAILAGAGSLASSPVWLRREAVPVQFHDYGLRRYGFDQAPVPYPTLQHRAGFVPNERRGPGAQALPPDRLTIKVPPDEGR